MDMFKAACISFLFFSITFASAQRTFLNFYGTSDSDYANVIIATDDGGYAFMEQVNEAPFLFPVLVKTDCNGNIEWTQGYRFPSSWGVLTTCFNLVNAQPYGYVMLLNYREAGTGNYMVAVVMVDNSGNIVWSRTLPLNVSPWSGNIVVYPTGMALCGNPNNSVSSLPGTAVVELDYSGNVVNSAVFLQSAAGAPAGITRLSNGYFAITGTISSGPPVFFHDVFVTVTDPSLDSARTVVYSTFYDDDPYGITSDNNDNIYVCGRGYFIASNYDAMLLKLDKELNLVFSNFYDAGTPQGEIFRDIVIGDNQNLFFCGDIGASEQRDPIIASVIQGGSVTFCKKYPIAPSFTNYFLSIDQAWDGGFVATGDVRPVFAPREAPILKTDALGNDGCYAQEIALNVLNPAYTFTDMPVMRLPYNPPTTDSIPVLEDLFIHQIMECNLQNPCIGFDYIRYSNCPDQCVNFYDASGTVTSWHWEFEGGTPATSDEQHPQGICYSRNGTYTVTLTVSNGTGTSVMEKEIEILMDCPVVFPNIITPDGDGLNDQFTIAMLPREYELRIFDRWGVEVNRLTEQGQYWKGDMANGKRVNQGVYYYTFTNLVTGELYKGFIQVSY